MRLRHWANRTHRFIAMVAVLFVIIVTLTGLVLNHADTFGLSSRGAGFLSSVYGIEAPLPDAAFGAGGIVFASTTETLYADGRELASISGPLRGAVVTATGEIVIATPVEVLLATGTAMLVEHAFVDAGAPIVRLGVADKTIVAETTGKLFAVDTVAMALVDYDKDPAVDVAWSVPTTLDEDQTRQISKQALGKVVSWERVLTDLHSGRILPVAGRYIVDLAALSLLYLCFTGVLIWIRTRNLM